MADATAALPPLDATWQKLCLQTEGILQSGPALQLGFKADFRGHAARLGMYFGNVGNAPLMGLKVEIIVPPASKPALTANAAPLAETLGPRAQSMQMLSLELLKPFATPPHLSITWQGGARKVQLPVMPFRFHTPWPLGKEDFFRLWRGTDLHEKQSKFTFGASGDPVAPCKTLLSGTLHLAVLEGVDPSPTNICAAGALACKGGVAPPAPGGQYILLRLEIIPNYATGADGMKRAAARLTVRGSDALISESLNQALTTQWS